MARFSLIILFLTNLLFTACSDKEEEVLAFGISKPKADLQLTRSSASYKHNIKACPKFKKISSEHIEIKRTDKFYSIFEKKTPAMERLIVYHKAKPGTELGWKWEQNLNPSVYGKFVLDTNPSCFYLGRSVGLKPKTTGKLKLYFDGRHRITNVLVFDSKNEKIENCPYQNQLKQIQKTYLTSKENFVEEKYFRAFVKELLKSFSFDNCNRGFDTQSVSMYKLCGVFEDAGCNSSDPVSWFKYIHSQSERFPVAKKVINSSLFQKNVEEKYLNPETF